MLLAKNNGKNGTRTNFCTEVRKMPGPKRHHKFGNPLKGQAIHTTIVELNRQKFVERPDGTRALLLEGKHYNVPARMEEMVRRALEYKKRSSRTTR